MQRKDTNEESQEFAQKLVKQVQMEMEENFNIALAQMKNAEEQLVQSLTCEQKELYENFCKRRKFLCLLND